MNPFIDEMRRLADALVRLDPRLQPPEQREWFEIESAAIRDAQRRLFTAA
jgi:hypothetical protein